MGLMEAIGINGGLGGKEHYVHCLQILDCLERSISLGCNKFCTEV